MNGGTLWNWGYRSVNHSLEVGPAAKVRDGPRWKPSAIFVDWLTALDRARRQARHDLALREYRQEQHRQRDDQRRGGERSPAQLVEGNHVVDGDGQGAGLAPGEHDAEDKVVPGEDHRQDERDGNARPCDRRAT